MSNQDWDIQARTWTWSFDSPSPEDTFDYVVEGSEDDYVVEWGGEVEEYSDYADYDYVDISRDSDGDGLRWLAMWNYNYDLSVDIKVKSELKLNIYWG